LASTYIGDGKNKRGIPQSGALSESPEKATTGQSQEVDEMVRPNSFQGEDRFVFVAMMTLK
jgi:hypothetical protein